MTVQLDPNKLYHGVYPGGVTGEEDDITPQLVAEYEDAAGRPAAWIYFSHNWYKGPAFPRSTVDWIVAQHKLPFIRLMLRSGNENPCPDPRYTIAAINRGDFDQDLKAWAKVAQSYRSDLIVEWGTEMNGEWFAWNAKWNGKATGANQFQDAFRRIVKIIRDDSGAHNTTWVFHANDSDEPADDWNKVEKYYPGDAYVDWLGLSVYGAQEPKRSEACLPFAPRMKESHDRLHSLAPAKPIFLLEFGETGGHPNAGTNPQCKPAIWADSALHEMIDNHAYPALRGFSWWNETWENDDGSVTDMRLQSSSQLRDVFRSHLVNNPRIIDHPL
jgi:hypothetical protein